MDLNFLKEVSPLQLAGENVKVLVLGYGNVGMGAIHEAYTQGAREIKILHSSNSTADKIEAYLQNANLIINGAEQPKELRGKNYLVTKAHVEKVIAKGSVVIDLVGGSASNRSAVENVVECTYLTDPHFEESGVFFSALWGWPMLGMANESAKRYSSQICEVLLDKERLIDGLSELHPGVKPALLTGPFTFS